MDNRDGTGERLTSAPPGVFLVAEHEGSEAVAEALGMLTQQRWLEAVAVEVPLRDGTVTLTIHKTWPATPAGGTGPRYWWAAGDGVLPAGARVQVHTSYRSPWLAYELAVKTLRTLEWANPVYH